MKEGFDVMVYTSDDPIVARQLEDIGCCAIMPLASLIGSGMGILNPWNLQLILEQSKVPVLVDAGVGTASDAAIAMELGCQGVLMNTAIAGAQDPIAWPTPCAWAYKPAARPIWPGACRKALPRQPQLAERRVDYRRQISFAAMRAAWTQPRCPLRFTGHSRARSCRHRRQGDHGQRALAVGRSAGKLGGHDARPPILSVTVALPRQPLLSPPSAHPSVLQSRLAGLHSLAQCCIFNLDKS